MHYVEQKIKTVADKPALLRRAGNLNAFWGNRTVSEIRGNTCKNYAKRIWVMCETCIDLYFSLEDLGFCFYLGDNMHDLVKDYADIYGSKKVT